MFLGKIKKSKNTVLIIVSQTLRLASQSLFFVFFARSLGAEVFGVFSAVMAMIITFAPFSGIGSGSLIVKKCCHEKLLVPKYFGNSLLVLSGSNLILFPIMFLIGYFFIKSEYYFLFFFVLFLSEMIFSKIIEFVTQSFQSQNEIVSMFSILIFSSVVRIFGLILFIFFGEVSSENDWMMVYLLTAFLSVSFSLYLFYRKFGKPLFYAKLDEIKESFWFALGVGSQGVYNESNKIIMYNYDSAENSGNFSAAYKIMDIAFTPVRAFLTVSYVGFFKSGSLGIRSGFSYAVKKIKISMALGLLGSIAIVFASLLVEHVLGESYSESVDILYFLIVIPIIKSINFVLADCLTGSNYQKTRCLIQLFVAFLSLILSMFLVKNYSWIGAVLSTLICEITLGIVFYFFINKYIKYENSL